LSAFYLKDAGTRAAPYWVMANRSSAAGMCSVISAPPAGRCRRDGAPQQAMQAFGPKVLAQLLDVADQERRGVGGK
jgi:hypothetical protein